MTSTARRFNSYNCAGRTKQTEVDPPFQSLLVGRMEGSFRPKSPQLDETELLLRNPAPMKYWRIASFFKNHVCREMTRSLESVSTSLSENSADRSLAVNKR
jgi:hypothetical protein